MELVNLQSILYTFDIEKKAEIVHAMEVCKELEV
jgi:hypothetical protein